MGKTITYTPDPNNPVRLTDAEQARIDELAELGGPEYYADIPELDEAFFQSAQFFGPEAEATEFARAAAEVEKESVSIELTPSAAAYMRHRGPDFRSRLGAIIEAHIAEAARNEQRAG